MAEYSYYTEEGLKKLKKELADMKTKERSKIAGQIQEAREKGDLSENAEYDAAKDAQAMLELKISKLEKELANARVIDESKMDTDKVLVLSKVKIKNLKNDKTMNYTLVSNKEADVKKARISIDSPLGKGLLGKKVGEVAEVKTPAGEMKFEIIDISR